MRPSLSFYPARRPGYRHRLRCRQHATTAGTRRSGPVTTPASSSPAAQPSPGPAPARRGWGAVSIVLVGAFMALLDSKEDS